MNSEHTDGRTDRQNFLFYALRFTVNSRRFPLERKEGRLAAGYPFWSVFNPHGGGVAKVFQVCQKGYEFVELGAPCRTDRTRRCMNLLWCMVLELASASNMNHYFFGQSVVELCLPAQLRVGWRRLLIVSEVDRFSMVFRLKNALFEMVNFVQFFSG